MESATISTDVIYSVLIYGAMLVVTMRDESNTKVAHSFVGILL